MVSMKTAARNSILVVDDEKANIITLTHILSPEYTIYAAKNGPDAIETAKEFLPDVILLDILMPDMDGYEVLFRIKNTEETKAIPVIFITGLTDAKDEEKGMSLGASDYITKPFSSEIVKLRIRNQMQIIEQIKIINRRLRQQTLMASISQSFLSNSDIGALFNNTLQMVGEFMGIAQVLIYNLEDDDITLTCKNEWVNPVFNFTTRVGSQLVLKEPMLSVIREFRAGGSDSCLHSNNKTFKAAMKPYRVNFINYITTPLFVKGKMCAVMDFSREEDGLDWSESDINLAVLVAGIISGVYERSAMERQSSIVENSPQFIFYLSPNGEVNYINPAAIELTGCTKAEILSGGLKLIFGADTAGAFKNTYIPNTLREGSDSFEITMTRKDGELRILAFTSFTAENGNFGAIALDVTEKRTLEAALVAAKEQAEQSSRAKSEFLSRMSHEMHTPMNAIIGMTNIAKISESPAQKADCLEEIDNASRHLLRLIDDVLDVSSLEKSTLKLEYSAFSLKTMLGNVIKMVQLYTDEKRQALSFDIDPLIPDPLTGDEKRLTQVVRNLMMNACKFTPEEGKIHVSARVSGEENGKTVLEIAVIDTGIGIPKEKQESIFNSFEQADGSFSREFGGAGLGLAISKRIVEMMGGSLRVESETGKGSKFTLTFKAEKTGRDSGNKSPAESVTRSFKGKKALLAEDMAINREILVAMLADTEIQIDCAENGLQAVEMFSADPGKYDIILMDINMPVMDGWEAARRIRSMNIPEGKQVIIVALTANTLAEDINKSYEAGMNDHVGKPLDFEILSHKLNKYL